MYKIELIFKQSILNDILPCWINSGREDNSGEGCAVFYSDSRPLIYQGVIEIESSGNRYHYNMSDFYRVKVSPCAAHDATSA